MPPPPQLRTVLLVLGRSPEQDSLAFFLDQTQVRHAHYPGSTEANRRGGLFELLWFSAI